MGTAGPWGCWGLHASLGAHGAPWGATMPRGGSCSGTLSPALPIYHIPRYLAPPAGPPPVTSLQQGCCTHPLQLPHPWFWVVLNLPHAPPAQLSPVLLGAAPTLPRGVHGDTAAPQGPVAGDGFAKKTKGWRLEITLDFLIFIFFFSSQNKTQFGFISAGERLAPNSWQPNVCWPSAGEENLNLKCEPKWLSRKTLGFAISSSTRSHQKRKKNLLQHCQLPCRG